MILVILIIIVFILIMAVADIILMITTASTEQLPSSASIGEMRRALRQREECLNGR